MGISYKSFKSYSRYDSNRYLSIQIKGKDATLRLIKNNNFNIQRFWIQLDKHFTLKTTPQLRFPTRLNNVHLHTNENKTFIVTLKFSRSQIQKYKIIHRIHIISQFEISRILCTITMHTSNI